MAEITSSEAIIREFDKLDIRFNSHVLTDSVRSVALVALSDIEADYGAEGHNPLAYHNSEHALHVAANGLQIARRARMGHLDQAKAVIAGLCHDRFHDDNEEHNEALSGEYAVELMRAANVFWAADYADVYQAILDTSCQPNANSIGQSPKSDLGKVVADADVYYFGEDTPVAWSMGLDYFSELHPGEPVNGDVFRRFAERFARILRFHRYQLPTTANGDFYRQMKITADYADSAARTLAA